MPGWNEAIWSSLLAATAVKSVAVLAIAAVLALAARRRSAASLHLIWTAAFAALLALPFLPLTTPAVRVPVPDSWQGSDVAFRTSAAGGVASESPGTGLRSVPLTGPRERTQWSRVLLILWALGTVASFSRMAMGWAAMRRTRKNARALMAPELDGLAASVGVGHPVPVMETVRGGMPMTFGFLRPAVFLPGDAGEWSAQRRRVVLLHELAHVRRGDTATHLLARTALSVYWWNPLAWIAWHEFLKQRERAADDLVLSVGERGSDYGSHLLEIASTAQLDSEARSAAVAMAGASELEGRLREILDSGRRRSVPRRASVLGAVLAGVCLAAPLASLQVQKDLSEGASNLGYAETRKFLQAQIAAAKAEGEHSQRYGMLVLKLAGLERRQPAMGEAEALYAQAFTALEGRPEAAQALTGMGIAALVRKDVERASEDFQRAQLADPSKGGEAWMWMAVVREKQNRTEDAEAAYKAALAVQAPDSAGSAVTMRLYAEFLRRQSREDDARRLEDQEAALRKALSGPSLPQGARAGVYRAGGAVSAPQLISKVEPDYSEEARVAKYQGMVMLSTEIGVDGQAVNTRVMRALGLGLDEKAMEAVRQWRFKPGVKDGQAVVVAATIEVNFRLQ